ncbi:unnamed protein product, partial [Meganyctiphanes norvegica]
MAAKSKNWNIFTNNEQYIDGQGHTITSQVKLSELFQGREYENQSRSEVEQLFQGQGQGHLFKVKNIFINLKFGHSTPKTIFCFSSSSKMCNGTQVKHPEIQSCCQTIYYTLNTESHMNSNNSHIQNREDVSEIIKDVDGEWRRKPNDEWSIVNSKRKKKQLIKISQDVSDSRKPKKGFKSLEIPKGWYPHKKQELLNSHKQYSEGYNYNNSKSKSNTYVKQKKEPSKSKVKKVNGNKNLTKNNTRGTNVKYNYNFDLKKCPDAWNNNNGNIQQSYRHNEHFGIDLLKSFVLMSPEKIILNILKEKNKYSEFIAGYIEEENFLELLGVLAIACNAHSNSENLSILLNLTLTKSFLAKLVQTSVFRDLKNPHKACKFFDDFSKLLHTYIKFSKDGVIDMLPKIMNRSNSTLEYLKRQKICSPELLNRYEELKVMLKMEPPNDFHKVSVLPSVTDITSPERPFLRKNITNGQFRDAYQYLDIQFRLLHEDFIRPFRESINDIISDSRNRGERLLGDFIVPKGNDEGPVIMKSNKQDVRFYKNVKFINPTFRGYKLYFNVQLDISKITDIDNYKIIMYGNFVCFTCDKFKTFILGSIVDRINFSRGIIGVNIETNTDDIDYTKEYLMLESRVFFLTYNHVLNGLQKINTQYVPMERYILYVQKEINYPSYLKLATVYRITLPKNLHSEAVSDSDIYESDFESIESDTESFFNIKDIFETDSASYNSETCSSEDESETEVEVFVVNPLDHWPSEDELGLDSSQRKCLRNALNREIAIIQGPPGTGKTFMGLKLTQILLQNKNVWSNSDLKNPIVVVCYTNHALDQFLEGIVTFTENIVRVGSRTKSNCIQRFELRKLLRTSNSLKECSDLIRKEEAIKDMLRSLEQEIIMQEDALQFCLNPKGIIKLSVLKNENIIPFSFLRQMDWNTNLQNWLLGTAIHSHFHGSWYLSENIEYKSQIHYSPLYNMKYSRHSYFYDAHEDMNVLLEMEEKERKLDDEDSDTEDSDSGGIISNTQYRNLHEITVDGLTKQIKSIEYKMDMLKRDRKRIRQQVFIDKDICVDKLTELEDGLKLASTFPDQIFHIERDTKHSIWNLNSRTRWHLYGYWLDKLAKKLKARLPNMKRKYKTKAKLLQDVIDDKKLLIMQEASVVGMTTTGAASSWKLMQKLSPNIVIVEEAAEILEAHVITSLTRNCQHLIMIGDHQQLKPNPTVYELAKKYQLDTSLFERMIKNGLPYETLQYQHRMRPEISKLLVPSIYPHLQDHQSVQYYPDVKGMAKNIYFVSHNVHEKSTSDRTVHENSHEADFIMSLCRHLLLQGYKAEDITILTPYTGQLFLLKAIQNGNKLYKQVRICIVDSFQGEESNIILLSLVRSNEEGRAGFLTIDNRICVALSRAKFGFYIIGDMDMLCSTCKLWVKIKNELIKQDALGNHLPLLCQNHENEVTEISSGDEFQNKAPEGGCSKPCSETLPRCGHPCPRTCHINNKSHRNIKCMAPCSKKLCDAGHLCQKTIHEECDKICNIVISKTLPCGDVHNLACHIKADKYHCHELTQAMLPKCLHMVEMFCHQDPDDFLGCPEFCMKTLKCGHICVRTCHVEKDPNHEEYECLKPCTKVNKECNHKHTCQKMCYEVCGKCIVEVKKSGKCGHEQMVECHISPNEIRCNKKCEKVLTCGHVCPRRCYEECGGCQEMVKKVVPRCGHEVQVACCEEPKMKHCKKTCPFELDCGHACQLRCCDECETNCPVLVETSNKCPRNHLIKLPCHLYKNVVDKESWSYCCEPCRDILDCGHSCSGTCGQCLHGRFHVSCKKICNRKLICGHMCQQMCIEECSKCVETCGWKCSHKKCQHPCDEDCEPCMEWCSLQCKHHRCRSRCGEECRVPPCTRPCDKKLHCGHPCAGFCGDPCPAICRICNRGHIRRKENCRYVCLEDCLNDIEVYSLTKYLKASKEKGLKTCPECGVTIRSNHHFSNIIKASYHEMMDIKKRYFDSQTLIKKIDIKIILQDEKLREIFPEEVKKLMDDVGMNYLEFTEVQPVNLTHKELKHKYTQSFFLQTVYLFIDTSKADSDEEYKYRIYDDITVNECEDTDLHVRRLASRVMNEEVSISSQMLNEIACEVQRLRVQKPMKVCRSKLKSMAELNIFDEIEVDMEAAIKDKLKHITDEFLLSIFEKQEELMKTALHEQEQEVVANEINLESDEKLREIFPEEKPMKNFIGTTKGHLLINIFIEQEELMKTALHEQLVELSFMLSEK